MLQLPYRQIHMDFHTSKYIPGVGDKFDTEEFARVLKEARVNSINLFAKCHHGMYYYPTKLGTMHPELKFDLLGAQMDACRKAGIRTCIYTCVSWNEDWADRHPEWLELNSEGVLGIKKPFSAEYVSWRSLCLNNPGLVEYMKQELQETCTLYRPAGYWIDIVVQNQCVCPACMAEMRKMSLNPALPADVKKHDRHVEIKFMKELHAYLQALDPELGVYFNGFPFDMDLIDDPGLSAEEKRRFNTYVDVESLPSDDWGYTHFPILVNYLNRKNKALTMMNGKFHKAWGDFGSLRNLEALEYECFRAVANGTGCCVGDQLHPSGEIDKTVYRRIGEVFASLEEKEPWLRGTDKVSQIGVFASNRVLEPVNASSEGVYRMLSELHMLFDFIDFRSDLESYDLVILPDTVVLSPDMADKLKTYLGRGGKLLLTGKSGLQEGNQQFALEDFGMEYLGESDYNPRYMHMAEEEFPAIPPMDYVVYEQGERVKAQPCTQVLSHTVHPYFNRTYDRFCSHRQTPPAGLSEEPCILQKSNVIYIANPLFMDYALNGCKVYREIIEACISRLALRPVVATDLPTTAEVTLRRKGTNYILHILHYIIQRKCKAFDTIEEKIPLYNRLIRINSPMKPENVVLVPEGTPLEFSYDGTCTEFVIPVIDGHRMVEVQMADTGGMFE